MPTPHQSPIDTSKQKISVDSNDPQNSEVIIKFLWFLIHIKNPNPHTIEIVKRVLKFCELLLLLAFAYALVKIIILMIN
jgi:hypothetical protein